MKRSIWKYLILIAVASFLTIFVMSCGDDDGGIREGVQDDCELFDRGSGSGVLFDIRSPYQNVNWTAYGQFKAANHVHTINSDGSGTMEQVLKAHYDLDYDIVTITDHVHAEAGHGRRQPLNDPPGNYDRPYTNLVNRCVTNPTWTGAQGLTFNLSHITQERLVEFETGTAPDSTRTVDRGMMIIKGTAELAPDGDEVNVFFYPENRLPPPAWSNRIRGALQDVHDAGAIGFINHPGRTTRAEAYPQNGAASPANPSNQGVWIRYYANLYMEFPISTVSGMEIFNRRDVDSRHDRILWDNINKLTIPQGRFVWGYGNDDLHSFSISATGNGLQINYNMFVMPSNTPENFRHAMINGHSYMVTVAAFNEGVNITAETPSSQRPRITSITFSQNADTITINAENASRIMWISDGVEIFTEYDSFSTINLAHPDIIGNVGSFVRANVFGPGGMAVTQPISTRKR